MDHKEIGLRMETRRKELELTLSQVAQEVGVAASTIQRYEKGNFEKIKMPIIEAVAGVLQVNPAWLIGKTDDATVYDESGNPRPFDYKAILKIDSNSQLRLIRRYRDDIVPPPQPLTPEQLAERNARREKRAADEARTNLAYTLMTERPDLEKLLMSARKATPNQVEAAIAMLTALCSADDGGHKE